MLLALEDGMLLFTYVQRETVNVSYVVALWGDMDGNGRVNHNDARLILQFYVGIIKSFPVAG